jgi:LasA protease
MIFKLLTKNRPAYKIALNLLILCGLISMSACLPQDLLPPASEANAAAAARPTNQPLLSTPLATRPAYQPGELVDYIAQAGDTLPALASHFNTSVKEIRTANPFIPADATTMPPTMPMKIPIYYQALWGSPYQIIPDSLFVNGPAATGFDTTAFVNKQPGWLKNYSDYVADQTRTGAEIVDYVATNYSVSPRLLLAIIEYQLGGLSQADTPANLSDYPLNEVDTSKTGLYRQLAWAANVLSNGYYEWRAGTIHEINLPGDKLERPDPWQNAATVALHDYFALHLDETAYDRAVSADGFAQTYRDLFGDPWTAAPHIPGSLRQPTLRLPFLADQSWAFTGGPHGAWGEPDPLAAIDFAPPSVARGCVSSQIWATAVADGTIVRTGVGIAVLDLDGDGNEHTGWDIFYLHLETKDKIQVGAHVKAGQPLGHPSCEGGEATGSHVHLVRKYNGEWILAEGPLAYNLEGWISHNGAAPYLGTLTRGGRTITACTCSDQYSQLQSEIR